MYTAKHVTYFKVNKHQTNNTTQDKYMMTSKGKFLEHQRYGKWRKWIPEYDNIEISLQNGIVFEVYELCENE